MRKLLMPTIAFASMLAACAPAPVDEHAYLPVGTTGAFAEAAQKHAEELARVASAPEAGLWLVQDASGRLVASGVNAELPSEISSEAIDHTIPGAKGADVLEFGFARTAARNARTSVRVAYATVPSKL
ncbi:MAG: hypothetical protein KF689_14380 [Gemmatimonadaceae bacterium]|nr:hypothetical protein [Gemmatimonadaceae bacterium]